MSTVQQLGLQQQLQKNPGAGLPSVGMSSMPFMMFAIPSLQGDTLNEHNWFEPNTGLDTFETQRLKAHARELDLGPNATEEDIKKKEAELKSRLEEVLKLKNQAERQGMRLKSSKMDEIKTFSNQLSEAENALAILGRSGSSVSVTSAAFMM